LLYARPAIREPQLRTLIASVSNELHVFAVRDQAIRQRERLHVHLVSRELVIEREWRAVRADVLNAAIEGVKAHGREPTRRDAIAALAISRSQRIAEQQMLQIREQQLLMLLLVVEAQRRQVGERL